jgi:hypothetical protein
LSSALATKLLQENRHSRMVASCNVGRHPVGEVRWLTRCFGSQCALIAVGSMPAVTTRFAINMAGAQRDSDRHRRVSADGPGFAPKYVVARVLVPLSQVMVTFQFRNRGTAGTIFRS